MGSNTNGFFSFPRLTPRSSRAIILICPLFIRGYPTKPQHLENGNAIQETDLFRICDADRRSGDRHRDHHHPVRDQQDRRVRDGGGAYRGVRRQRVHLSDFGGPGAQLEAPGGPDRVARRARLHRKTGALHRFLRSAGASVARVPRGLHGLRGERSGGPIRDQRRARQVSLLPCRLPDRVLRSQGNGGRREDLGAADRRGCDRSDRPFGLS